MKRVLKVAIVALALVPATPVMMGEQDGWLSTGSSTAYLDLSMNLSAPPAAMIKVSGLSDVSFSKVAGEGQLSSEERTACVYMIGSGTYSVTVTANPLLSSNGVAYPYTLNVTETRSNTEFNESADVTSEAAIIQGTNLIPSDEEGCGNIDNLRLTFTETGDLDEAFSATSTIQVTVTPG